MHILEISDLTKRFVGLVALNELSFEVEKGELLGLIGPNGAGKTTIFNLITGVYRPDSGKIKFKGKEITGLKTHQICEKGICRTHQVVQPFPNMTVLENVMIGAFRRLKKSEEARQEALRVVEYSGLLDRKDTLAKNLTIADRKRLELSRALATKPELLLIDECVAGLNPTETDDAIKLIKNIQESGITVIMVEHVMRAIMSVSERIVVIHNGRKIAEGVPKEIANDKRVIEAYLGETYLYA